VLIPRLDTEGSKRPGLSKKAPEGDGASSRVSFVEGPCLNMSSVPPRPAAPRSVETPNIPVPDGGGLPALADALRCCRAEHSGMNTPVRQGPQATGRILSISLDVLERVVW